MGKGTVQLNVDRDSVAMGDDMQSHARTYQVARGTRLSKALRMCLPEIKAPGWSWVVKLDGVTTAVWSVDHGVQLLVPDRSLQGGPVDIVFRYFQQIDPAWLFDQLAAGERANSNELSRLYAPIRAARSKAAWRRREQENPDRLLSAECIAALQHYGAEVTLHADKLCEFTHQGAHWSVQRQDSMAVIYRGGGRALVSLRPHSLAEAWLVGMLGATERTTSGLPDLPEYVPVPGLRLDKVGSRWVSLGAVVVQTSNERAGMVADFAFGRTIDEVRAALAV